MQYKYLYLLVIFLAFMSCSSSSKIQADKGTLQSQQLDSLFNLLHTNGMFNGSVLITKNDSLIYEDSFGYANEETKEKLTPESIYYIASISKQFTAMGIMMLQEMEKLSFDDKIKDILPNFPNYLDNITIRQLLNHTSGITDTEYYRLKNPSNKDVTEVLMNQDSLELPNGSTFRYSNTGYVLLALIIEKVSEQRIDEFFEQSIFNPLEMNNTTAKKVTAQKMPKLVEGYNLLGVNVGYKSSVVGPGGIYSTINDLNRWNKAINSNKLVSKQTKMEAFKNGLLNDGPITISIRGQNYGYGFGWMLYSTNEKNYVQHDGSVESYRSLIKKNLTDGYDYIYLTNNGSRIAMNELTASVDKILENSEYVVPIIPIVHIIVKEFIESDLNVARTNIKDAISKNPDGYNINENSINRLAYTYLKDNQKEIAIEVFKLNTEIHPSSANAFDSLAEGYFSNEQYELSKENYQKSIELNPENKNAKEMIAQIEKSNTGTD